MRNLIKKSGDLYSKEYGQMWNFQVSTFSFIRYYHIALPGGCTNLSSHLQCM